MPDSESKRDVLRDKVVDLVKEFVNSGGTLGLHDINCALDAVKNYLLVMPIYFSIFRTARLIAIWVTAQRPFANFQAQFCSHRLDNPGLSNFKGQICNMAPNLQNMEFAQNHHSINSRLGAMGLFISPNVRKEG